MQLRHTYDSSEMYGDNYGYRSGLNQTMVRHLGGTLKISSQIGLGSLFELHITL